VKCKLTGRRRRKRAATKNKETIKTTHLYNYRSVKCGRMLNVLFSKLVVLKFIPLSVLSL
jgi:hypothetical protein